MAILPPASSRWRVLALALVLGGIGYGAGAYVFFHKTLGDWMVLCHGKAHEKDRNCRLSAPPPKLTSGSPPNVLIVAEPKSNRFRLTLEVRDLVSPGVPAFIRIDQYAIHEAQVSNGVAVWQGDEAIRILGEMRAGKTMVFRVQTAPDGLPRDTHVSLKGFRTSLRSYRNAIRAHRLLSAR